MQKLFTVVLSLIAIPSGATPWDTPWKHPSSAKTPWGATSEERKISREAFFKGLNGDVNEIEQSLEERTGGEVISAVDEPVEASQLSDLPWKRMHEQFPKARLNSHFMWPIEGGHISSSYGIRNGKFHEGLDIAAPKASSIRAVAPGWVAFSGSIAGYGNTIVIYHGNGVSTVYAHTSKNLKLKGVLVKRGEKIALVGNTGHATGYHCHFEVRESGKPQNPLRFHYSDSPLLAMSSLRH